VWAFASSFGGGLVAGDRTQVTVEVAANARAYLSTQASTKVYRNPDGLPCGQRLDATVGAGGLLVVAPDPVQCFAEARYEQRQRFDVQPGGGLVVVDWLSVGRAARGEAWAFQHYHSRNELRVAGDLVLQDALELDPAVEFRHPDAPGSRFRSLALVILWGAPVRERAKELLAEVAARPVQRRSPLVVSASPLADGALLRLAAERTEEIGSELRRWLSPLAGLLDDDPWARKW
jgi:urease accessory protein